MTDLKVGGGGAGRMSVPAFGDWEQRHGPPDYSLDFSKIREARKLNKSDPSRASGSVGNDEELLPRNSRGTSSRPNHGSGGDIGSHRGVHRAQCNDQSPNARRKIMSYFHCCIGA